MNYHYEFQKKLQRHKREAVSRGVIAVLDIGTSKIICMILRFDPNVQHSGELPSDNIARHACFEVVGVRNIQSRGVRFGEIVDMKETERDIRQAIQEAQKMAQVRVDHAIVCFSGGRAQSYNLHHSTQLEGQTVSERDIVRVMAGCDTRPTHPDFETLHFMPIRFALDDQGDLSHPLDQVGYQLGVEMHKLDVEKRVINNVLNCVKSCDLQIAGLVNSAYASGISVLTEDEKQLGAACIDMGAGTTSVSVFVRRHLVYSACVRMGGDHVSRDISYGLNVSDTMVERIKNHYGGVVATRADDRDFIGVGQNTGDWDYDSKKISRADLISVMEPRLREILEEVRMKLEEANFYNLVSQRIVLTGGASQVMGMEGFASRILGHQVRIGRHLRIKGAPQTSTTAAYAAAVGSVLSFTNPQDEFWDFDSSGLPMGFGQRQAMGYVHRLFASIKENW